MFNRVQRWQTDKTRIPKLLTDLNLIDLSETCLYMVYFGLGSSASHPLKEFSWIIFFELF